jgi:gluconolactonase
MPANITYPLRPAAGMLLAALLLIGCRENADHAEPAAEAETISYPTIGTIERNDPALDDLIPVDAVPEVLAEGFEWSEGPVWVDDGSYVLFSDVPSNVIYKWEEGEGHSLFLKPSGYTATTPRAGEEGSNGLTLDAERHLVLAQHGDRRIASLDAPLDAATPTYITLADRYDGKRFNSPNDLVYRSNGDLYFTDPPYGLEYGMNDPARELDFQGVYRLGSDGEVELLTDDLTRPNGLAFSPDEQTLYVANSDPERAIWMAYDVLADGAIANGRVFFDATPLVEQGLRGLPDGLKVDQYGNLFATGPGGVLIIAPDGNHLGTINTGQATANCAFGDDGATLYITADMYLLRIRLSTKGDGF